MVIQNNYVWVDRLGTEFVGSKHILSQTNIQTLNFICRYRLLNLRQPSLKMDDSHWPERSSRNDGIMEYPIHFKYQFIICFERTRHGNIQKLQNLYFRSHRLICFDGCCALRFLFLSSSHCISVSTNSTAAAAVGRIGI